MRARSLLLGALATAFLARVLGQVVVILWEPGWLPPSEEWYSGLVPYPVLLPTQVLILAVQARISWDFWHQRGFFAVRRPRFGIGLCWISYLYFVAMVLRYVVTMISFPERRWTGGMIPIFFHWVLAAYLFFWGRFHRGARA